MTTNPTAPAPPVRPIPPRRLAWLENELATWRGTGVIDDTQAQSIRSRYVAARRFTLTRLLLLLGGAFVGVGLLWLVATNLDQMSALLRFVVVTSVWLGFVVGAEVLAERQAHAAPDGSDDASPVVGGLRLVAAMAFGAVVFQAAQSVQVPAYEPSLVAVWGLGALLYAYAAGAVAPLIVGIAVTTGWYVWETADTAQEAMGFVLPVLVAGVVAGAAAMLHAGRWRPSFAASWREASAVLALLALFVAALPLEVDEFAWPASSILGVALAVVATAAAVLASAGRTRLEAVAPLAAMLAGILLVLWESPEPFDGTIAAEGYVHAFVSVAVYVVAAGWYAVLGVLRDSPRLTVTATGALVLFTTVQSFAVFAPIITGATLFLLLGGIFLATGYLFDRGRRHLVASLEGASA